MKIIHLAAILMLAFTTIKAQIFTPDTIPVIVHVIHNNESVGTGHNLNQAQVISQLNILNNDFAGQGWNVGNVPAVWSSLVANSQIVFVPAVVDTNGNALLEPGIDRIDRLSKGWQNPATMNASNLQNYLNGTIKPQSIWNTSDYCNVWVLDMTASGLLGYSTFPANSGLPWITGGLGTPTTDGVCVHYKCWGDTLNVMSPFDHGRSATHEFGHWFGLIHMYNGCVQQSVTDVPVGIYNQWFSSPVYPDLADTCAGYPDGPMFMNFMCYAISDSDIYMFTNGQANAMRQAITNSRSSLLNSGVWHTTSIKDQHVFANKTLKIYPNPGNGMFKIVGHDIQGDATLKVINSLGTVIYQSTQVNSNMEFQIDLSNYEKGIYYVILYSQRNSYSAKLIIEN